MDFNDSLYYDEDYYNSLYFGGDEDDTELEDDWDDYECEDDYEEDDDWDKDY